jgi:hypothetical protein
MVQDVRREERFDSWPRPLDRVVDVSDDEVFALWWDGRDRFSDSGRCDSILVGYADEAESIVDLVGLRRCVGAVLLLTIGGGPSCGALRKKASWNPLSIRFIMAIL